MRRHLLSRPSPVVSITINIKLDIEVWRLLPPSPKEHKMHIQIQLLIQRRRPKEGRRAEKPNPKLRGTKIDGPRPFAEEDRAFILQKSSAL
jgi:hypothetical protein